jgi:hypothetical protein
MKPYVVTTGVLFAVLTLVHLWRIAVEGRQLLTNPWWVGITVGAAALSLWAWRLVRLPRA